MLQRSMLLVAILFLVPSCGTTNSDHAYTLDPTLDAEGSVYVPRDLSESIEELKSMIHPQWLAELRSGTEDDVAALHFPLGQWLRNNWGLWQESRLFQHFAAMGLSHPDDMSGVVLTSLWRDLNSEPLRVEELVAYYQAYWRAHTVPDELRCPNHDSRLEQSIGLYDPLGSGQNHLEYVAMLSCVQGELWAWKVDRGLFEPGRDLLDVVREYGQ
jgi:Domain of unknown function (DUF6794)